MRNLLSIREVIVLLVSALVPGATLALVGIAGGTSREAIWAFPLATAFALAAALLGGLPAVILLNSVKAYSLPWYWLAGLLVAVALAGYFILPNMLKPDWALGWPSYAAQFVILAALSIAASTFYWVVARPDKIHGA